MRTSRMITFFRCDIPACCHVGPVAMLVAVTLACVVSGCGKHEPSYKDRIGTIDPATTPIILPEAPTPPKK